MTAVQSAPNLRNGMASRHVVIYGGGMAGAMLAKRPSDDVQVTLVGPRDYFEVPMAAPRNLVDPSLRPIDHHPFRAGLAGGPLRAGQDRRVDRPGRHR